MKELIKVKKRTLLLLISVLWLIAGVNILKIGITLLMAQHDYLALKLLGSLVIFFLFLRFVFLRTFRKHAERIENIPGHSHYPYQVMDVKGFLIMLFMILLGICSRTFHWFSDTFIEVFYPGLASALIVGGCLFLIRALRTKSISEE